MRRGWGERMGRAEEESRWGHRWLAVMWGNDAVVEDVRGVLGSRVRDIPHAKDEGRRMKDEG